MANVPAVAANLNKHSHTLVAEVCFQRAHLGEFRFIANLNGLSNRREFETTARLSGFHLRDLGGFGYPSLMIASTQLEGGDVSSYS